MMALTGYAWYGTRCRVNITTRKDDEYELDHSHLPKKSQKEILNDVIVTHVRTILSLGRCLKTF